jgi:hypothetical protein
MVLAPALTDRHRVGPTSQGEGHMSLLVSRKLNIEIGNMVHDEDEDNHNNDEADDDVCSR